MAATIQLRPVMHATEFDTVRAEGAVSMFNGLDFCTATGQRLRFIAETVNGIHYVKAVDRGTGKTVGWL